MFIQHKAEAPLLKNSSLLELFNRVDERVQTSFAVNMPTSIDRNGQVTEFAYDAAGGRAAKRVYDWYRGGVNSTFYVSEAYEVSQDEYGNETVEKYIFAGNQRIAKITSLPGVPNRDWDELDYIHKDHLGSTTVVTDANGDYLAYEPTLTQYTPYGTLRNGYSLSTKTDYAFTDQEMDRSTGFYNYDERLYNPEVGMFLTADSVMQNIYDPQYLNRYSYCRNNPINLIDPT
jgi:RHS repeat-associated protein